jgi:hypothetical protein
MEAAAETCEACSRLCGQQAIGIVNLSKWLPRWKMACADAMNAAKKDNREYRTKLEVLKSAAQKHRKNLDRSRTRFLRPSFKRGLGKLFLLEHQARREREAIRQAFGVKGKHRKGWKGNPPMHHKPWFRQLEREHMRPWAVARELGVLEKMPYSTLPLHMRTQENWWNLLSNVLRVRPSVLKESYAL